MKTFEFVLMAVVAATQLFIMYRCAAKFDRMGKDTHHGIRFGYVSKGTGSFLILCAVFDYLHGEPLAWPWLLLFGLAMQGGGIVLVSLATRRVCHGTECPERTVWPCHQHTPTPKCDV